MSMDVSSMREDAVSLFFGAREFVGEFLYAPLGVESSDTLNGATLFVAGFIALVALYRLSRPAPHSRYKHDPFGVDFGRHG